MKKKNSLFSKRILQVMADDIVGMMADKSSQLLALALFEEIPFAGRGDFIMGLSGFFQPEILSFFELLKLEYGAEYAKEIDRAEKKFAMAGLKPKRKKDENPAVFYKAYATVTRHLGKVALNILTKKNKTFSIECFSLHFNAAGIENYILAEDMILGTREQEMLMGLEEISYKEAVFLLGEAYEFNCVNMNRPAMGKCFYHRHLHAYEKLSALEEKHLYAKLSPRLELSAWLNSIFLAINNHDMDYIEGLVKVENEAKMASLKSFYDMLTEGMVFLEGNVSRLQVDGEQAEADIYLILLNSQQLEKHNYHLQLQRNAEARWEIAAARKKGRYRLSDKSKYNPFNTKVYCRVYEIFDGDLLLNLLETMEDLDELGELPYGMHMRIMDVDNDDLEKTPAFMSGVIADIVVNGDELVLICQSQTRLEQYHQVLQPKHRSGVRHKKMYTITLGDAYRYVSGNYSEFEQTFSESDPEFLYNSALCYLSAHYIVRDVDKFHKQLATLLVKKVYSTPEQTLYFLYGDSLEPQHFLGECLLTEGHLLSVSAFGSQNLNWLRKYLEADLYEYLDFIGFETREEGIFEALNQVYADEGAALEQELKAIYLQRWFKEKSPALNGMSPEQACKTQEGSQLLWQTFKQMQAARPEQANFSQNKNVTLTDYMEFLDFKKVEN